MLKPGQWIKLIDRLSEIDNPVVPIKPSKYVDPGGALEPARTSASSALAGASQRFRFAQFEFPWALGPDDGRYVLRPAGGGDPTHVIVFATLGAPQRRLLGGRRAQKADPEPDPTPVPTARATVVSALPLPEEEAEAWLRGLGDDGQDEALAEAVAALNRAIHAHRLAAVDSGLHDATMDRALVARLGYGSGDQVAEGRWAAAIEVPLARHRRVAPSGRSSPAGAAGRRTGRARRAAGLRAAHAARARGPGRRAHPRGRPSGARGAGGRPGRARGRGRRKRDMAERLDELREQRAAVGAAANAAVAGALDAEAGGRGAGRVAPGGRAARPSRRRLRLAALRAPRRPPAAHRRRRRRAARRRGRRTASRSG